MSETEEQAIASFQQKVQDDVEDFNASLNQVTDCIESLQDDISQSGVVVYEKELLSELIKAVNAIKGTVSL